MAKYLSLISGAFAEVVALVTSAGAGDAGKIVSLDGTGRLDGSVMPVGITADTQAVVTSEALAAGDFVNIYNLTGSSRARKADATTAGKQADAGFSSPGGAPARPGGPLLVAPLDAALPVPPFSEEAAGTGENH